MSSPFRFECVDSMARRLHPLSKLCALLALSFAAAIAPGLRLALVAGLVPLCLAGAGFFKNGMGFGLRSLGRELCFLSPLAFFIALFRVVDPWRHPYFFPGELPGALFYVARLALLFMLAKSYFRSTSSWELAAALSSAARALSGREDLDPGFYLSLAIGFVPRCFDAYARALEAALCRGYDPRRGRLAASVLHLESFVACCIKSALATALALEARCYSPGRALRRHPWRSADFALSFAALMTALASAL